MADLIRNDDLTRYRLFGLTMESPFPLPELLKAHPDDDVDVFVRTGPAPENGYRFDIDKVARFSVSDGSHIFIDVADDADLRTVRLFLLGSAMGALLHQRGMLPLHANAVEINGRAYCFAGESGAGKSTLAKAFCDAGYKLLTDDVAAVRMEDRVGPMVEPGVMRLRLGEHPTMRGDDKSAVAVPRKSQCRRALPLGGLFVLERGDAQVLVPLEGAAAVEQIYAHTYRGFHVAELGSSIAHWDAVHRILDAVEIRRFVRPWDTEHLAQQVEWLVRQLG